MSQSKDILLAQLAVAAAMVFTFGLASAGTQTYDQLDINQDGVISQQEAIADEELAATFDGADVDGDGKINHGEFARFEEAVGRTEDRSMSPSE